MVTALSDTTGSFLQNTPDTYEATGVPVIAHWIFQFAFADTCSTVTSGAMIGRTGFRGDILYSIGVTGFIYPIIGHWAWGPDGWLALMGTTGHFSANHSDKASAILQVQPSYIRSVVWSHSPVRSYSGPVSAEYSNAMEAVCPPPHNLTVAAVGGFILWFGWYGFNPGSTLSAMDVQGIGRVATNTTLAACGGGMAACIWRFGSVRQKANSILGFTTNGFLAGLVAITCPCYWVHPLGAIFLGFVAGCWL